jgi:inhibitor of cysteine peptidase
MSRLPGFFAIALLAALLVACGSSATRLVEGDAGSTVELQTGDKLEVVLVGNPTTGYQWEVGSVDQAVLKPAGEPEYETDPNAEGLVGAGGTFTFTFEAVAPGQTTLELVYRRPWEEGIAPVGTFEATVVVK